MNVSRLTFTKEMKEKMNKPISHFKKGELRWDRLKELESEGKLNNVANRLELSKMLGAQKDYGAEYSWVSNLIKRGHIQEILTGFDANSRPQYEYHTINTPMYSTDERAKKIKVGTTMKKNQVVKKPITGKVYTMPDNGMVKMVIRYRNLVIELDNMSETVVKSIIEVLSDK